MHCSLSLGALTAFAFSASCLSAVSAQQDPAHLRLRYATFDPLDATPAIPAPLQSADSERLFIVQFDGVPTQAGRAALRGVDAHIQGYLPDNAYVVRMAPERRREVEAVADVRWVGPYHAAYRVDPELIPGIVAGAAGAARYNMMVVDKRADKPALGAASTCRGANAPPPRLRNTLYELPRYSDEIKSRSPSPSRSPRSTATGNGPQA